MPAVLLAGALGLAPTAGAAGQRGAGEPSQVAQAMTDLSRQAWQLATDGRLDDVWQRIDALAQEAGGDPTLAKLREEIDAHRTHERQRREQIRSEFERKLAEMQAHLDGGRVRKALTSAVQAMDLTRDPRSLLKSPKVQILIAAAQQRAAEHEEKGAWLKALSLYRGLDYLYDQRDPEYGRRFRRVARRVELLRLYAPEELHELYAREAEERGDPPPDPWNVEDDHWRTQLEGVEMLMLSEALSLGARSHIESTTFEDLLIGGIDSLRLLFETKGLERTFPTLADADRTRPFLDYLDSVRSALAERQRPMNYNEAIGVLTRIMERNEKTVMLPDAVVVHEFGEGAMGRLDEFSSIIWPHQRSRFERTTRGEFSGVGIQISLVNRELTVVTPLEDTPAHRAGIRAGDKIATIDDKSTVGIDLEQAVDRITGPEGTTVVLGIKSAGDEEAREVKLVRSKIRIESVKGWQRPAGGGWDYVIDPALNIGYVRMTTFGPNTADELDAAVERLGDERSPGGLILDLRFNPGGRLDAAVEIANRFLSDGAIVSTTQKRILGRSWRAIADASHTYADFPVIVLINKGSASASEIVAGALQDHKRGLVVGERSFGKGSVQNLFRIGGDTAYLKLTTQYYKLPNGQIIHRRPNAEQWGITPDVPVRMTDRQVADIIQARLVLDVLHDPQQGDLDPDAILDAPDEENAEAGDEAEAQRPPVRSADDILAQGMDPQLETALLLLKTRLLGEVRS